MDMNYEEMLEQVKDNLKKVEEEGKTETQFAFASPRDCADFFRKAVEAVEGWEIQVAESRLVPRHYQNSATLVRKEFENKQVDVVTEEDTATEE
jgi:hypothetical protein